MGEKRPEQGGALTLSEPTIDLWLVVALRVREHASPLLHPAGLGIGCAIINPCDPGRGNGTGTHRARLERHIKRAAVQPGLSQGCTGRAKRQHLRMGARVCARLDQIMRFCQHIAIGGGNHRPDRHLPQIRSRAGQGKGAVHVGRLGQSARGHGVSVPQVPPRRKGLCPVSA